MPDPRYPCEADETDAAIGAGIPVHFPIVAIGASAGGFEAFEAFFAKMPPSSGMAFVLIQHLDPTYKSKLPELVGRFTSMSVHEIVDGIPIVPNNVYIIPPDYDLGILHGSLHLVEPPERRGLRHPIDSFFRSLALDQGADAIVIVVSGTGTDGTLGLRDIADAGGYVLIQDPASAKFDGMPRSGVNTGLADLVLPVGEMPNALIAMLGNGRQRQPPREPEPEDGVSDQIKKILLLLRAKTGHDFWQYKKQTIVRRIERRMAAHRLGRMTDYVRYLQHFPEELEILFNELLIGVTRFFRDTEAFKALQETVIPQLIETRGVSDEIRVWVPACSTGEEAVSIAILFHERLAADSRVAKVQIFASDIDPRAISVARRGFYPKSISADVWPEFLKRYFTAEEGGFRLTKIIRDSIVYAQHNLIKDPPFSRLDLISCRNVLIYMSGELQKKVMPLFHYALKPGGFLFLGTSETIGDVPDIFAIVDRKVKIFRRLGGIPRALPNLTIRSIAPSHPVVIETEEKTMESPAPSPNLPDILEKLVIQDFTPSSVLVNRKSEVLCIRGRTGKYLEPAQGTDARNLIAMAREGLRIPLTVALRKVFEQNAAVPTTDVVCPNLRIKTNGDFKTVNVRLRLLNNPPCVQGFALVVFEEVFSDNFEIIAPDAAPSDDAQARIRDLEQNLHVSRDYLKAMNEELEVANEELKSSNEELQSTNEELQSINEEHETSKEELQSVNEELVTVNCELESKLKELATTNNDMINLFASTEIATLFLNRDLHIKRYTPEVVRLFPLIQSDVGRPLRDITGTLDYPGLVEDAHGVLQSLIPRYKEASSQDGRWYKIRILPYRTTENVIDGVVITFIDNSDQKALEVQSRLATVVRDSNDAVTVTDFEGRLLAWNRGAERIYGLTEANTVGLSVFGIFAESQHDEIRRLLNRIACGETVEQFETERELKDGRRLRIQVTATLLRDDQGRPQSVATTEREMPELKSTE